MERSIEQRIALFPPELTLMIELMKERSAGGRVEFAGIDPGRFIGLCLHHRVFPAVHQAAKRHDPPAAIADRLQTHYRLNAFRMFGLSAEIEALASRLAERGIRAIFLKGPLLAADLYGDISRRCSGDIDLLVPIGELERTDTMLRAMGYAKQETFATVLNDWRWRRHHVNYAHPERGVKVEVHWRLHPGPGRETSFDELWTRSRTAALARTPARLLGLEDLFLYLSVHGARHGWSRLRWLDDIRRLCGMPVDWRVLRERARKLGFLPVVEQALILSADLLGAPVTAEMLPARRARPMRLAADTLFYIEREVNLHAEPVPEPVGKYHKRHVLNLMSARQKTLHVLSLAHPFADDLKALPLPKPLHFLYFPLRPLLWAWRRAARPAR